MWSIVSSAARDAWFAATSQQGQLEALQTTIGASPSLAVLDASLSELSRVTLGAPTINTGTTPRRLELGDLVAGSLVNTATGAPAFVEIRNGSTVILRAPAGTAGAFVAFAGNIKQRCAPSIGAGEITVQATAGLPATPPGYLWASGLATNAFNYIAGTQFESWGNANITGGPFRGNNPIASIVNAYNDPGYDEANQLFYFFGGGHGDGSCNAVVKCDPRTFEYSVAVQATPASVYMPQYMNTNDPFNYPSGVPFQGSGVAPNIIGWFKTVAQGLDPVVDAGFIAPQLARVVTHQYAAAAYRQGRVHYFYLTYGEANVLTGQWEGYGVNLGSQLQAIFSSYGNQVPNIYTRALYDDVTDRFFVTMPTTGFRNGFFVFNPTTRLIEKTLECPFGNMLGDTPIVKIGRKLYCFRRTQTGGFGGIQNLNQGFICDMDEMHAAPSGRRTLAGQAFTIVGDTAGGIYQASATQESIPCYWDGVAIRRWNYSPAERGRIYSVNINPEGGAGTNADPLVLRQTRVDLAGTVPDTVVFVYSRLIYVPEANAAICIPRSNRDWFALRIA